MNAFQLLGGSGMNGSLGLGDEDNRTTPTLVARAVFDGEAVLMVACGEEHTAAVTEGGGVFTFGTGVDGQLGHGTNHMTIVTGRKEVFTPQPTPRVVQALMGPTVCKIAAGTNHSLAVDEEGGAARREHHRRIPPAVADGEARHK